MCFRDYTKALEIMQGLVDPDHRGIAELYPYFAEWQLGITFF